MRAKDLKEWCTVAASNGDREGESEIRIIDTRPEPEFGIVNLRGSVSEFQRLPLFPLRGQ